MTDVHPHACPLSKNHRWKVLAAGVAANAAFSVAFSGIPITAVLMRRSYALDNATLGLLLGLIGLGIALSELPWGALTDRWGDRPVLLLGLGGTSLVFAAMAWWAAPTRSGLPDVRLLGSGLLLSGLLGGSVNGASGRAIMMWFHTSERGLAMSIRQTAIPLGGGIGALALPWTALHFGFGALYGLLAALCAMGGMLAWAWVHDPAQATTPGASPAKGRSILGDAAIWRVAAGIGILCAPQFAVLSFGTIFLHDFGHATMAVATATMACIQLGAMVTRIWSGRWTDRHRNRPIYLRTCTVLVVLLFGLLSVASLGGAYLSPLLLAAMVAVCGICVSAWHGVAYVELATLAGACRSGTALGLANTSVFIVCFFTPLAIPYLLAAQGWGLVWMAAACCAAIALPLLQPAEASAGRARTT
jgi:sugar phosphate permease